MSKTWLETPAEEGHISLKGRAELGTRAYPLSRQRSSPRCAPSFAGFVEAIAEGADGYEAES
jgi:hypothetical protein